MLAGGRPALRLSGIHCIGMVGRGGWRRGDEWGADRKGERRLSASPRVPDGSVLGEHLYLPPPR
jgi:hypothetical protein